MKRLPIEGLPPERPLCPNCGRKLAPVTIDTRVDANGQPSKNWDAWVATRRVFTRWSSYQGLWCRLRCALDFATAAHRAGYRIRRRAS